MRRFALVLYASTALIASSTLVSQGADIDRVWELCSKRARCDMSVASADVKPAILIETLAPFAQQQRPDPFHQFTPQAPQPTQQQAQNQAPQQQAQAPNVLVQAPPKEPRDFFEWVMLALGGIFTAIFGTKTLGDMRKPKLDIGELLQSDDFKVRLYQGLQQVVGTGLPGAAISQIPGVGMAEPLLRRVVDQAIAARIGSLSGNVGVDQAAQGPMTVVPTEKLGGLLDGIEKLIGRLNQPQGSQNVTQAPQQPR